VINCVVAASRVGHDREPLEDLALELDQLAQPTVRALDADQASGDIEQPLINRTLSAAGT
jgi:hypothetical protein